jgi:Ca2+-transporting ATPase
MGEKASAVVPEGAATAGLSAAAAVGLSAAQAARRLAAEGPNALPAADRRSGAAIVLGVLREPMFSLLTAAALVYLLIGDLRESIVLGVSIVVVIAIAAVQERKAERALEALRDLSSPRALVRRDGVVHRIAGTEVVRGDLILLAEGDRVPADARLQTANDLQVDESLLTGESLPVEKRAGGEDSVYSGTLVVKGQGSAEVTATGPRGRLGAIGLSLAALAPEKTQLERETTRVVRFVAALAISLSILLGLFHAIARDAWLEGALAGLTLAMAILPEEFPLVLTVFLALGAWRIARHGVLTRRLPAIEMLGAATVLCVDKTGTLTENRMALAQVLSEDAGRTLEAAALACEADPFDPMERAILDAATPATLALRREWTLERDYPFGADFLAVCHVWRSPAGRRRVAIKGAAETVLPLCGEDAASRQAEIEAAAGRGLRLLAVAELDGVEGPLPADPRAYRLRWLGFVALADPLRPEVPEAVAQCRRAGIRVVMITGDYAGTALAIARQAGIDPQDVHARVRPDEKLRLVQALKAAGEVVAMTGDGVNDAPALKAAHIGIAMGERGTDVAREAAALVLTRDDFGSIVATVRLGRRIYENIRNAMRYLLAVHVPIAGAAFLPVLLGWPALLLPVHVVFLEFVIDPACSVAFEAEQSDEEAMLRPPRDPRARLFDGATLLVALGLGASLLVSLLLACGWAIAQGRSEGEVRALGFAAIVFGNLALILASRSSERTILDTLLRPNPALWWVIGGALAALFAAIYLPAAAQVFRFEPLGMLELGVAIGAGALGILWLEAAKLLRRNPRAG